MTSKDNGGAADEMRNLDAGEIDGVAGGLIAGDGGCIRPFPRPKPPIGCWPPIPCWPNFPRGPLRLLVL